MADPVSRANAVVRDFAGLVTNAGPVAVDPNQGAMAELVNLSPARQGELTTRPGLRPVSFDDEE